MLIQLARALIDAGRLKDALELARRAYEGHLKALGYAHYWTVDSEQTVAETVLALRAVLPGEGPAVAARVGAGEQHAVILSADDFDAARPVEVADHVDGMATPG